MSSFVAVSVIYTFFRLMPLLLVVPLGYMRHVPLTARIVVTIALALIITLPMVRDLGGGIPFGLKSISLSVLITEFFVGAVLAFSIHVAAAALHFFSHQIEMQMGMAAGSVFDPSSAQMEGVISKLLGGVFAVSMFSTGFFYEFVTAFQSLFKYIPHGYLIEFSSDWYKVIGVLFSYGFILVAPVIVALSLVDVFLAVVSRSLPQVQIYFVGLPIKVAVGILSLSWLMSSFSSPLLNYLSSCLQSWDQMIRV